MWVFRYFLVGYAFLSGYSFVHAASDMDILLTPQRPLKQQRKKYFLRDHSPEQIKRLQAIAESDLPLSDTENQDPSYVPSSYLRVRRPSFRAKIKRDLLTEQKTPQGKNIICYICGEKAEIGLGKLHIDHFAPQWSERRTLLERIPIFHDLSEEEQKEQLSDLYNAPGLRYTHAYCNLHRTNETPKDKSLAQVQQGQRLVHELRLKALFNELGLPQFDAAPWDNLPQSSESESE
jgi:hypothetical protein